MHERATATYQPKPLQISSMSHVQCTLCLQFHVDLGDSAGLSYKSDPSS